MRKPQRRALRLLGVGAFTATLAFALGTTVGVLVARPPTPEALKPAQAPTSAPVSQREFADERSVTLTISATGERALRSPAQGRLTSLSISAGTPVESSQSSAPSTDGPSRPWPRPPPCTVPSRTGRAATTSPH